MALSVSRFGRRAERTPRGRPGPDAPKKPQVNLGEAWLEAKRLIVEHRGRLALGIALMLISRVTGLVLPWSTKLFVDDILVKGHRELFMRLIALNAGATLISAATGFALSQVLGVA